MFGYTKIHFPLHHDLSKIVINHHVIHIDNSNMVNIQASLGVSDLSEPVLI